MKIQALGLICLLSGVLAVPVPTEEQAQNSQVQPMQDPPVNPLPVLPPGLPEPTPAPEGAGDDSGDAGDDSGDDSDVPPGDDSGDDSGDDTGATPAMMMSQNQMHSANMDMDAFQQMVSQVQSQIQQIQQLAQQHSTDANGLMQALVDPMSHLNQTMAMSVSRLFLPAGGIGGIGGILGGATASKKPAALGLLSDLLDAVSSLIQGLLTRGPIGELLNGILGGVLSGVGGTASGVLGGGAAGQVPQLLDGVLGSVGTILPGAGAVVGGGPGH